MSADFNPLALAIEMGAVHAFWGEDPEIMALADGADVTSWTNYGSDGNPATGTAGTVPRVSASGINGRRALDFNGTDEALQIDATLTDTWGGTNLNVLIVVEVDVNDRTAYFLDCETPTGGNGRAIIGQLDTGSGVWRAYNSSTLFTDGEPSSTGVFLMQLECLSGELAFYIDGALKRTDSGTQVAVDGLTIGANDALSIFHDGKIGFVAAFDSNIRANAAFNELETGLLYHYGVLADQRAAGTSRTFHPGLLGDCALWLDASDESTLTDAGSGACSAWADKSGAALDMGQSTSGNRPTITSAGINGLTVLDFDGTDDFMELALGDKVSNASDGSYTVFVVAQTNTTSGVHHIVCHDPSGNRVAQYARINDTAFETIGFNDGGTVPYNDSAPTTVATATPYVFESVGGSSRVEAFVNGSSDGGLAAPSTLSIETPTGTQELSVGARMSGTSPNAPWDGYIGEVIAFREELSAADREIVRLYLANKWGIPGIVGGPEWATAFTDDFDRSAENLEASADWNLLSGSAGSMVIASNEAATNADGVVVYECAQSLGPDQFVEATLARNSTADSSGLVARMTDVDNLYMFRWNNVLSDWQLYVNVGGDVHVYRR